MTAPSRRFKERATHTKYKLNVVKVEIPQEDPIKVFLFALQSEMILRRSSEETEIKQCKGTQPGLLMSNCFNLLHIILSMPANNNERAELDSLTITHTPRIPTAIGAYTVLINQTIQHVRKQFAN